MFKKISKMFISSMAILLATITMSSAVMAMGADLSRANVLEERMRIADQEFLINRHPLYAQKDSLIMSHGEHRSIEPRINPIWLFDEDRNTHNGSTISTTFSAIVQYNSLLWGNTVNGSSQALWHGHNPWHFDSLSLTTTIQVSGIGVSISAGTSGFNVTGSVVNRTATLASSIENNWRITQNYSNVVIDGVNLHMRMTASANFVFGWRNYFLNATDTTWF